MKTNPTPVTQINPRMLTIPMMAKYLSATNWFCEELIRKKQLPATKYGKSWVVDLHDVNIWIEEQKKLEKFKELAKTVRIMNDEEAQQFFAGMERDEDGNFISID